MGKRTREKSEEEIKKKIKRLERELEFRDASSNRHRCNEFEEESDLELEIFADDGNERESPTTPPVESDHDNNNEDVEIQESQHHQEADEAVAEATEEVPSEILAVLGEANKSGENPGKKIPQEVAERWEKILVDGLSKELKESLLAKTLVPENFQLAKAPRLNAEVASVLNEATKNRDKRQEKMQNQLGIGISGLANLTSELITKKELNKLDIIKNISAINQVLLDLHYEETMNRRRLLIPMLDKSFINIIQGVKRDKFLFGDNLGENIKTTKSIEKTSLQIKKAAPSQQPTPRRPANQQGNSRGPPRYASGARAARAPAAPQHYYQSQPAPAARRPPPPPPAARRLPPPQLNRSQDRRSRR